MDNSTISMPSPPPPPPDFADDMEIENELDSVVSEGSTPASISLSICHAHTEYMNKLASNCQEGQ
jgi:hypothetical protein